MYRFSALIGIGLLLLLLRVGISAKGTEKPNKSTKSTMEANNQKKDIEQFIDVSSTFNPPQTLPSNFKGHSLQQIVKKLESVSNALNKDQFESSETYKARLENLDSIITPLSMENTYAFRIGAINTSYDADKQVLTTYFYIRSDGSVEMDRDFVVTGSYPAVNKYGVKAIVQEISDSHYSLKFPTDKFIDIFDSTLMEIRKKSKFSVLSEFTIKCKASIPIQPELAKSEIDNVAFLILVGLRTKYPGGLLLISTDKSYPSFDSPSEINIIKKELKANMKAAYLFSRVSGHIFAKFNGDSDSQKMTCE